MKNCLNIVSNMDLREMCKKFTDIINADTIDTLCSGLETKNEGSRHFLDITTKSALPHEEVVDFISGWIIKNYEIKIMSDLLKENFTGFIDDEIDEILCFAKEKISCLDESYNKKLIIKKLSSYLKNETILYIDGFIRFRLKEYKQELEMLLLEAIDEFFCIKEYDEFLELMRSYVEFQPPMIDLLHIKTEEDGGFSLYDFKKSKVKIRFDEQEPFAIDEFLTEDDRLISILLTLTPKRIIWHGTVTDTRTNLIKTIQQIFGERFSQCCGCELCKSRDL